MQEFSMKETVTNYRRQRDNHKEDGKEEEAEDQQTVNRSNNELYVVDLMDLEGYISARVDYGPRAMDLFDIANMVKCFVVCKMMSSVGLHRERSPSVPPPPPPRRITVLLLSSLLDEEAINIPIELLYMMIARRYMKRIFAADNNDNFYSNNNSNNAERNREMPSINDENFLFYSDYATSCACGEAAALGGGGSGAVLDNMEMAFLVVPALQVIIYRYM
jgi:hypothetical protein